MQDVFDRSVFVSRDDRAVKIFYLHLSIWATTRDSFITAGKVKQAPFN